MSSLLKLVVLFACLTTSSVFAKSFRDKKSALIAKHVFGVKRNVDDADDEERRLMCGMKMSLCASPFMAYANVPHNPKTLVNSFREHGITEFCGVLTEVKLCLNVVLAECSDLIPEESNVYFDLLVDAVNFVCVDELEAINDNKECLFSEEYLQEQMEVCGNANYGEICQILESECGIDLIEERCHDERLADSFREFYRRVKSKVPECNQRAVAMKLRHFLEMTLRRR
jgi:hypothetical protein